MNFYHVYVLLSLKDGHFYIGFTHNVFQRFSQHEKGLNKSTKSRRPLILLYYESHRSKSTALKREAYFKTSSGRRTLHIMLGVEIEKLLGSNRDPKTK